MGSTDILDGKFVGNMQTFTFGTGRTCKIKKISAMLAQDVRRSMEKRKPKPPMQRVNYGDEQEPVWSEEPNPADPEYQRAMEAHERAIGEKAMRLCLELGTVIEIDAEAMRAYREVLATEEIEPEEASEKYLFITRICATGDDLTNLIAAIYGQSQPTEEAVDAAKATF